MAAKKKPKPKPKPRTIDEYLAGLSPAQRGVLEALRSTLRTALPKAEECISYQMPAFRLHGKALVWFGAAAKHFAIYGLQESKPGELADYDTSGRGTIRFQAEAPLPASLIRRLVKARIPKATQ
jgi:uncharacterized protein YdhG (YjbR/CyaY superfamily)